jgi:hypothetical protein
MKGLCIGVVASARPYVQDVVRLCWITEKPSQKKKCAIKFQALINPKEAVGVGVNLIRASIIGDSLIRKVAVEANAFSHVGERFGGVENEERISNSEEKTEDE